MYIATTTTCTHMFTNVHNDVTGVAPHERTQTMHVRMYTFSDNL